MSITCIPILVCCDKVPNLIINISLVISSHTLHLHPSQSQCQLSLEKGLFSLLLIVYTYETLDVTNVMSSSVTLLVMFKLPINYIWSSSIKVGPLLFIFHYLILAHTDRTITLKCLDDGCFHCACYEFNNLNPDHLKTHIKLFCPYNKNHISVVHVYLSTFPLMIILSLFKLYGIGC